MRDEIYRDGIVPSAVLTWHEEESRFAFQNGEIGLHAELALRRGAACRTAASRGCAGRFSVAAMPAGPGGRPTAALGGAQLAINATPNTPRRPGR